MALQQKLEDILSSHGAGILKMGQMPTPGPGQKVAVSSVRQTPQCLVFSVAVGDRKVVVKAFNASWADNKAACAREIQCQRALSTTTLTPLILGAAPDQLLVVTHWQEGPSLADVIDGKSVVTWARRLGQWYRSFSTAMGQQDATGSWHDYLARYHDKGVARAFRPHGAFLRSLPIRHKGIAKNDAHLTNFIVSPDDHLMGIDFEAASLKPVAWDILLTARVLTMQFPDATDTTLPALLDGWYGGETPEDEAEFRSFVALFARTTAKIDLGGRRDRRP